VIEDRLDLLVAHDHRQAHWFAGADYLAEIPNLAAHDVAIREQEPTKSLVLRRGADLLLDQQVSQERVDLRLGRLGRVAQTVEEHESSHPQDMGLLPPATVVMRAAPA